MTNNTQFKTLVNTWLNQKKPMITPSTHASFTLIAENHLIPYFGKRKIGSITEADIQSYISYLYNAGRLDKTGGLTVKTIRDVILVLRLSMEYAYKERAIPLLNWDLIEYPKELGIKKVVSLSKDQEQALIQCIYMDLNRKTAGILIALFTGVRIGELCGLQMRDISLTDKTISINKTVQRIYDKKKGESYLHKTTLIVGRNNTAKTSCFSCIGNVLEGNSISFNDYPLLRREDFYTKIALFMEKKLSYEDLCSQIEVTSIDFLVDYSLEDPDDNLGALSPFIIDVDVDTTTALIRAEYRLKTDEKTLWSLLESSYYKDGTFSSNEEAHNIIADNFGKLFGLTVYAINPNNLEDKQVKSPKELHDLFPFYFIPAERVLGEDDTHNSSLGSLISSFFDMSEADLDPDVAEEIKRLRTLVEKASISEEDLEFKGKSKTDFALDLICECSGYCVPDYIKSGLKWLNDQRVLE